MTTALQQERLRVTGLTHSYGRRPVLAGLSFHVASGEVVGLLGPNGSGKSTALSVLCGLEPQQGGSLHLDGEPVRGGARALLARTGVIFQSPSLDDKLTARQNLALAARLRALPRGAAERALVDRELARARLTDRADEPVGRLSGGMKRRLDIARALLHQPSLLLLDEPTAGLDEASFRATWEHLDAVRRERSVSILVSTHRADEAERCDRVVVLADGRAATVATPEELRARVAHDLIVLTGPEPEALRALVEERLGVAATVDGGTVRIECERGHALIPRLVEALPDGRLDTVSLRHPSLADVFLALTGGSLDDEVAEEVP